jgi:putative tricarboxylic transport membrane protein
LANRAELAVAGFLLAIGALVVADAARLPRTLGQSGAVGPRAVPYVVGTLLLVTAVLLAVDVLRGGKGELEGGEDVDLSHGADWGTVALLAAAFLSNALLIERIGWPLSGALLFFGAAYALGARRLVPLVGASLAMSFGSQLLFVHGLGLSLPAGPLAGVV